MTHGLFSLDGKTALVTGGSQGIGLMISRGLVEAGAKVYVSSRKAEVCDRIAAELSEIGECVSLPADVSTEAEARRVAAELTEREGKLHVLVNNAGAAWGAPLTSYPDSAWDKVMGLNVKSVFNLSVACLPLLQAAAVAGDPARVINVGSIDGFRVPELENYAYSSSKAAVHHLTRILAQRLAGDNITVNAIAPGPFPSKMMAQTIAERGDQFRANCPMGRLGEPDDMAGISVFLAARASAYVTGQIIAVDGGFSTAPW
jgi:NAD(P)-dependent dehydrogenase (short-subunit alcohol dehydrogenase family)